MRRLLKRWVTPIVIVVGLLAPSMALPAAASAVLCVTHLNKQPGPSGYAAHTTGYYVTGTNYKIVQYYQAGPGYLYLVKTVRRSC